MPYGSWNIGTAKSVVITNVTPSGSTSVTYSDFGWHDKYMTRAGQNAQPSAVTPPLITTRYVARERIVKIGRRSKAVFDKVAGRKTKNVYAVQTRYVPVKSRVRPVRVNRKPNNLEFLEARLTTHGSTFAVAKYSLQYRHTYEGCLSMHFRNKVNNAQVGIPLSQSGGPAFVSARTQLNNSLLVKFTEFSAGVRVGLGQIVAERKQTYSLLVDAFTRLLNAARLARRGRIRDATQKLLPSDSKELAGDRLAYSFGVKPLINDLKDIAETLSKPFDAHVPVFVKRGRKAIDRYLRHDGTVNGVRTKEYESGWVEVKYKIVARVSSSADLGLLQMGFGPLSLLWELTPWSFVIDWLLPIGERIAQWECSLVVVPFSIVRTTTEYRVIEQERTFSGHAGSGYYWDPAQCSARLEVFSCKREVLSSLPSVNITSFDENWPTRDRVLNSLALLRQQRK